MSVGLSEIGMKDFCDPAAHVPRSSLDPFPFRRNRTPQSVLRSLRYSLISLHADKCASLLSSPLLTAFQVRYQHWKEARWQNTQDPKSRTSKTAPSTARKAPHKDTCYHTAPECTSLLLPRAVATQCRITMV